MTKQETRELQMTGIMTDMAGKFEDGTITVSKEATLNHSAKGHNLIAYTEYEKGLGTVVIDANLHKVMFYKRGTEEQFNIDYFN